MDGIILSLIKRTTQGGIATISVVLTMLQLSLMTFFFLNYDPLNDMHVKYYV